MAKDLGLANDAAARTATPTPLGSLAYELYSSMLTSGFADKDFSSVYQFLLKHGRIQGNNPWLLLYVWQFILRRGGKILVHAMAQTFHHKGRAHSHGTACVGWSDGWRGEFRFFSCSVLHFQHAHVHLTNYFYSPCAHKIGLFQDAVSRYCHFFLTNQLIHDYLSSKLLSLYQTNRLHWPDIYLES